MGRDVVESLGEAASPPVFAPGEPPEAAGPLSESTILSLYPLTYLAEGDEVTVGCAQTESYAVRPADGAALLRQLGAGLTLSQAASWYQDRYQEAVDLGEFVEALTELDIHESFHALAGRRLGLRSHLSIGRRLYHIVFLTSMDGLVTVPRRKRYLPILAGMLADILVAATLTLIAAGTRLPDGRLSLAGGICLALAYTMMLRLLWQFYVYLETDLYYVATTVLGCVNLNQTARAMQRNRWNKLRGRTHALIDPQTWHARDRAIGRWYSWLLPAGWTLSLLSLFVIVSPISFRAMSTVFGRLIPPDGQSAGGLTDTAVFLLLNLTQIAVIWWLVRRDRARAGSAVVLQRVVS